MTLLTKSKEARIIQVGIVLYWVFFWFLNVVDKFIGEATFLWVGKDRLGQLVKYFSSIGIENDFIALNVLRLTTFLEILAFFFVLLALIYQLIGNKKRAYNLFFLGTLFGLIIFSFFSIGDQVFGDRAELLEHTTYWIALIISWGAYIYFPKAK
ncbi:MAG: hypothetical protein O3B47_03495 [bacterium]|nr:hypothetical protein [bacterium]